MIVFLQQSFVKAIKAANCPKTKTTVGIGATISKGQFCGKEPDWGLRPIAVLWEPTSPQQKNPGRPLSKLGLPKVTYRSKWMPDGGGITQSWYVAQPWYVAIDY